jgi:eukaryotic-like serine/threonine-protein kinase
VGRWRKSNLRRALRYLTAAVALRPDSAGAHHNLANVLWAEDKREEAVAEFRKVTELEPKNDFAHYRLGFDLKEKGDLDGAIAEFSLAWTLNPAGTGARYELFQAFFRQGRLEDFRAAWQNALESNPANHGIWYGYAELCLFLGREEEYRRHRRILLARFGDAADPVVAERVGRACLLLPASGDELQRAAALADRAVAAGPKHDYYGYFLATKGLAEYRLGRFDSASNYFQQAVARGVWMPVTRLVMAMALYRSGHAQLAQSGLAAALESYDWSETTADNQDKWIAHVLRREVEALVVQNLSAFLKEEYHPHDNKERLELIRACLFSKRYRAAVQLYPDAFAADPKLADDLKAGHLYNAACSAVLAAAGRGEDAKMLADQERERLRKQAVDWLRADLALWIKRLDGGTPEERQQAREQFQMWQRDPDLASVREKDVTKLPPDERQAFVRLWAEVAALLEKTKME